MVVITNLESKPKDCAECPACNTYFDDCDLLPKHYDTWAAQYKDCPLEDIEEKR